MRKPIQAISRRDFLQLSAASCGTLLIPRWTWSAEAPDADPHFFLQIFMAFGADASYFFDARPLALTAAGKMQNYIGAEPMLWTGSNGQTCLATALTNPLLPFRSNFSIVNGMQMLSTFDGHPQNQNFYYTGNAFGGESFLPHLNLARSGFTPTALDTVQNGERIGDLTNTGGTVSMSPSSVGPLIEKLQALPDINAEPELVAHLQARLNANAAGTGRFSAGSRAMLAGFTQMSSLRQRILQLPSAREGVDDETQFVEFLAGAFRNSIARSANWVFNDAFDTHAPTDAQAQPKLFGDVGQRLGRIFTALANTPYDSKRSLLDVTTVAVTTEFSRTMRQENNPIDATGTDHNPLNNSILLGGKGIRGGLVIGASDFMSPTETLSGAHMALDPAVLKVMGRPFDFTNMRVRSDLPATYDVGDYLTASSVINTLYSLFNVPTSHYRTLVRNGPPAPTVPGLLV